MKKNDITTTTDIELLVRTFYARVVADPQLSAHFVHVDFEAHFPRMIAFWDFLLLDKFGFQGNVFDAHRHLQVDKADFDRWLLHFHATLDGLFEGEKVTLAKQKADSIAVIFHTKLAQLKKD